MTLVRVALDVPGPTGDARAVARIRATPTRRRTVGDVIVLPAPFVAELVAGVVDVELAATGADWCWRVDELTPVLSTRYVAVPDLAEPIGYEDLVDVDPATLDPAAAPTAAWVLALEDANALITYQAAQIAQLQAAPPAVGSQLVVLAQDAPRPELLPAFTLVGRSVAVPPTPDLAVVTETMTTTRGTDDDVTLAVPAGTTADDLLVVVIHNSTTGGTFTAPEGWVELQHLSSFADYRATYVFAYPVTGAAPGAPTFVASGSARFVAAMFRVLGADLADPVAAAGTAGTRTTNTMHVPELEGAAGALVLSASVVQATAPNQPAPMVWPSVGFTKFLELPSVDGTAVTRSVLMLGWLLPDGDVPAHDVVAASSIAAGASQVVAIRAAS